MARSDYYIPVFDSLPGHKKEVAIREAMGWNGFESVGFIVWFMLRVAADFPDGELPSHELEATLRNIWKAAGIKPKKRIIQLVSETLSKAKWVEATECGDAIAVHDWEDGAGMFALKREKEKEKKRRQREAARKAPDDVVPGTPGKCPRNVPGENEKGKRENIPPNPPKKSGGDDSPIFEEQILSAWRDACDGVGISVAQDDKTMRAVTKIAKMVEAGKTALEDIPPGMKNFLRLKYDPEGGQSARMATWSLSTFAKSPSTYFVKREKQSAGFGSEIVFMECDVCGYSAGVKFVKGGNPDAGIKCINPQPGEPCTGHMWPE